MTPIGVNREAIKATAFDGEVVLFSPGPKPVDAAFTPEAILASLDALRVAAERAIAQRDSDP